MRPADFRTIAILRPQEASLTAAVEEQIEQDLYACEQERSRLLFELLDNFKITLLEIADCIGLRATIIDCQLHVQGDSNTVISTVKQRWISDADTFVSFDPTPKQLGFILRSSLNNPLMTAIIGYTSHKQYNQNRRLLQLSSVPCGFQRHEETTSHG